MGENGSGAHLKKGRFSVICAGLSRHNKEQHLRC